jgi:hypothetical protein
LTVTTTLAALTTKCRSNLRDTVSSDYAFLDAELQSLIGEGIDALTSFYPKEVVGSVSIVAGTYSYAVPDGVRDIYRITVLDASGLIIKDDFKESPGKGQNAGWEKHAATLLIPQSSYWTTGMVLQLKGYGPWGYIDQSSASSATTDLDQSALIAVQKYVTLGAYDRLCSGRAKFEQLQQHPETPADIQPITLIQLRRVAETAWEAEKKRLRFMRKMDRT